MKARFALLALIAIPILLSQTFVHAGTSIPTQTDDGLDPVNVIFTGYAPASWVAQNLQGWNPSPCSEPKTLDGRTYDVNMETPDTRSQVPPCWGPRFHIRIWDMGTDSVLGHWSVGAVHHEHTECTLTIFFCHHVIDSWEQAEAMVRATFAKSPAVLAISNRTLNNPAYYQGVYNDGNASVIQLAPTNLYAVTFQETGLPTHTPWSVSLNGTTSSSTNGNITIRSAQAAYSFTVGHVLGYISDISTGNFSLTANHIVPVRFTSIQSLARAASDRGVEFFLIATAAAWSVVAGAVILTRRPKRSMS